MKILVLLAYYNRPNMVRNALDSLQASTYSNFHVAVIDDGSTVPIDDEVSEYGFPFTYYNSFDTPEKKRQQGGSRHGELFNKAQAEIPSDLVITLCDDDAIVVDYFANLVKFFTLNPRYAYAYSHVRIFNPFEELPGEHLPKRPYFTNKQGVIWPACQVDSSQVCIQTQAHLGWAYPQTKNLDLDLFERMAQRYGACPPTGFDGQYKAIFSDQLGTRTGDPYRVIDL